MEIAVSRSVLRVPKTRRARADTCITASYQCGLGSLVMDLMNRAVCAGVDNPQKVPIDFREDRVYRYNVRVRAISDTDTRQN